MKSNDQGQPERLRKRELLREFFLNAMALALLKEAVLVPVRVEAGRRSRDVPDYFRG